VPVDVLTEIEIDRPRDEVAAFASDPTNASRWQKNIRSVEWETPPPVTVGSRLRFVAQFLGRTLRYTYEVREDDVVVQLANAFSGALEIRCCRLLRLRRHTASLERS